MFHVFFSSCLKYNVKMYIERLLNCCVQDQSLLVFSQSVNFLLNAALLIKPLTTITNIFHLSLSSGLGKAFPSIPHPLLYSSGAAVELCLSRGLTTYTD